jgi:SAM-dependent methyltransferase
MSEERSFPKWEELYNQQASETLPWYYPGLDPDLERALERRGLTSGKVLDLGTGPATQAIALAERGFDVTGVDISDRAIERASALAREKGLAIRFQQDDVLDSRLDETFEIIFDRGCFHILAPEKRPVYLATLHRLSAPGGVVFLKCFSVKTPGDFGPYRFTPDDITRIFGERFEILSIEETVYQGTLPTPPVALFCELTRR